MTFKIALISIFTICVCNIGRTTALDMTCYYDTFSVHRKGFASFKEYDLQNALPLCDIVIYGYVGIKPEAFELNFLHSKQHKQFTRVKILKNKYTNVKFILSLGGGKDGNLGNNVFYFKLLQATPDEKKQFIHHIHKCLLKYKFDGFNFAHHLPKVNFQNDLSLHGTEVIDHYGREMSNLLRNLKATLIRDKLSLSLTVLPNTDVKSYYNDAEMFDYFDFITLSAFDYSSPLQTPNAANYLAPLYDRHGYTANVNYTLHQSNSVPFEKLILGLPIFGRTWNTTKPLKNPKMPITKLLSGPAPGGYNTRTSGLLAWPEICKKLSKLKKISKKHSGSFAYRPGISKDTQGLLITYDDPDHIEEKVKFAKRSKLHGVAVFDITLDDFRGKCRGEKFLMLKMIKKLLN
ncbi:chitinase-like protein Idgf3 [Musca autumnalis]|uniref:chitinase-like protein Idgf3 n=1 Tax=Musca autumnalis TaxID=221902 RepID=UPI003CEBE83D